MNEIYIFGHKKPDTDSVTSSIALSYLKNKLGVLSNPRVLGEINNETKFVLDYFNIDIPKHLEDVKIQIKDLNYYKNCYINEKDSISKAYEYMYKKNITGVPIVDNNNKLKGLLTSKMIGNELINGNFTKLKTSYKNIIDVLKGEEILRIDDEIQGSIFTPSFGNDIILNINDLNKNSIMIVSNNDTIINTALNKEVKLLILVDNAEIKPYHIQVAKINKVNIIKTLYNYFFTSKLIGLTNYCSNMLDCMRDISFNENDYYDDFKEKSIKLGYNNYPVVDNKNNCLGLIRITDINNINRKKVILVDHNELNQSVEGLEEAEIIEIIDHHKLGNMSTNMPINFRNMTVGSTNTIIYSLYNENNVIIPRDIAGLMLSGIISDTLKFTSPTTTDYDIYVAEKLSDISKINIDDYSNKMFRFGTNLNGKTVEQIINDDIKIYEEKDKKIAVSQLITMNSDEILNKQDEYIKTINEIKNNKGYEILLLCVTDIIKGGSYIFYDEESIELVKEIFNLNNIYEGYFFSKCLSRKKQIVPLIMKVVL